MQHTKVSIHHLHFMRSRCVWDAVESQSRHTPVTITDQWGAVEELTRSAVLPLLTQHPWMEGFMQRAILTQSLRSKANPAIWYEFYGIRHIDRSPTRFGRSRAVSVQRAWVRSVAARIRRRRFSTPDKPEGWIPVAKLPPKAY